MRATVFGAGALGSVIGGLMSDGQEVTLVCRKDHAMEINTDGLRLDGLVEKRVFPRATANVEGLPVQDLVIVTVKAYDTRPALGSVAPLLGDDSSLLVIQNGLTVLRDVADLRPTALVGTASIGAQYIGPGHVRLTGLGEVVIGNLDNADDSGKKARESFRTTDIPCRRSADMQKDVWRKAVISSCINPLTAIARKQNAVIIDDAGINHIARRCFEESRGVGMTTGNLSRADIDFNDVEKVARATSANRSSMLQDIERGKRTEIQSINGEIVRIGSLAGLDTPINSVLVGLVSALASSQDTSNVY